MNNSDSSVCNVSDVNVSADTQVMSDCTSRQKLNRQLAAMLKGGVIMERIPADIRAAGGVSRMSDPSMIKGIQQAVSIPVMAKCRIGHFVEAQILQELNIDYIDESEVLSPADGVYHIDKNEFHVPFVCCAKDLGEALRRIAEGASMIRTKGEPGTGDVIQAVTHMRRIQSQIRCIAALRADELFEEAKRLQVPVSYVSYVHKHQKLPVVNFAAGGVATPAEAYLWEAAFLRAVTLKSVPKLLFKLLQTLTILLRLRVCRRI